MIYGRWKDLFLYQLSSHNLDVWVIAVLIECTFVCECVCGWLAVGVVFTFSAACAHMKFLKEQMTMHQTQTWRGENKEWTRASAARHNTACPCVKNTETQHVPHWLINKRPLIKTAVKESRQNTLTQHAGGEQCLQTGLHRTLNQYVHIIKLWIKGFIQTQMCRSHIWIFVIMTVLISWINKACDTNFFHPDKTVLVS